MQHIDVTDTVDRMNLRDKPLRIELIATTADGDELPALQLPVGDVTVQM